MNYSIVTFFFFVFHFFEFQQKKQILEELQLKLANQIEKFLIFVAKFFCFLLFECSLPTYYTYTHKHTII